MPTSSVSVSVSLTRPDGPKSRPSLSLWALAAEVLLGLAGSPAANSMAWAFVAIVVWESIPQDERAASLRLFAEILRAMRI